MKSRDSFMARANAARTRAAADKLAHEEKAAIRSARAAQDAEDRQRAALAAEKTAEEKRQADLVASRNRFLAEAAHPSTAMYLASELERLTAENAALKVEISTLTAARKR